MPVHPELQKIIKYLAGDRTSGYLMPNMVAFYRKANSRLSREFSDVLSQLEIYDTDKGTVGVHSIRHTFNTILSGQGTDMDTRMKLIGHTHASTNQIYNHAKEPMIKAIMNIPTL